MVFLEHNNNIYMGDNMIDSLANPIQCEDNYVRFELRRKLYYPYNNNAHFITFPDDFNPSWVQWIFPCITVHKPTKYEVENCEQIALTSKLDWDAYGKWGSFSKVESHSNDIESVLE